MRTDNKIVIRRGETIHKIIAETGVKIDIDEEEMCLSNRSDRAINRAKEIIAGLLREESGREAYHAKVVLAYREILVPLLTLLILDAPCSYL